jgi:hypothetical protein
MTVRPEFVVGVVAVAAALASSHVRAGNLAAPPITVEVLQAIGGLPAHIAGQFRQPVMFAEASTGESIVLDRRSQAVYGVDRAKSRVSKIVQIGLDSGQILQPAVLSLASNDIFAVADAPGGYERVQYFSLSGMFVGGFHLEPRLALRLVIGPLVLNGLGSLQFNGSTFLLNRPEHGGLISELDNKGQPIRQFGLLRSTGHEADRDLHLAFNVGIPLADPTGGFYFVFQTGVPVFRKYSAQGQLVFERHIEGLELDDDIRALPATWPRRSDAGRLPIVPPLVRTAAVDAAGRLWISLVEPFTYVYDARGDKIRTVQFRGADLLAASSLFFAGPNRLLITPGCYEFRTN